MAHKALLVLVYLFVMFPFASEPRLAIDKYGTTGMSLTADYTPHDPILITSDDDFETQGWPGSGTPEDPFVIEALSIDVARGGHCMELRNTRASFTVRSCFLSHYGDEWVGGSHASTGVKLFNSTHGIVENSGFIENGVGIYMLMSNNTMIKDNDFSGVADDPIISAISSHVTISNNICSGNSFGIDVTKHGHDYSPALDILKSYSGIYNDITVVNNTCTGDKLGILISGCMSGTIMNNTAFNNDYYWDDGEEGAMTRGSNFMISDSQNLLFTNNTGIAKGVCISIKGSLNISVVGNSFTSHEFHPAYDESKLAFFDYNYYSNYDGIDEDGDGIGDTPYFDLYGNIQDEHPLMYYPWCEPEIDSSDFILLLVIGGLSITAIIIVILWFKRS